MRFTGRRPIIVLTVIIVLAAGVAGIGIYGLVRGPAHAAPALSPPTPAATASAPTTSPTPTPSVLQPHSSAIPESGDPVVFARSVAQALFTWDTMSGLAPSDYSNAVVGVGDPSGLETPGLVSDLVGYLPSTDAWHELQHFQTRQSITIDSAAIPPDWPQLKAEAGTQLRAGTVAVTVTGTRHRTGTWEGVDQASDSPVAFTMFLACRPSFPVCHVLRLSQLGTPLK